MKSLKLILKEADDVSGLEQGQSEQVPNEMSIDNEEVPQEKRKSSEIEYVNKSLSGETIESANIILKDGSSEIEFRITSSKLPVRFVLDKSGKLVFWFKNRPTLIKK